MFPNIPSISIRHVLCISEIEEAQRYCALGQIALSDGLYEQASKHFENALKSDPYNLMIQKKWWLAKGYLYLTLQLHSSDLDMALVCLEKGLDLDPFDYHIYLGLGRVYFQKENWLLAVENFQVVNKAFGDEHIAATYHLAEIYWQIKRPIQSLSLFKKLITLGVEDEMVDLRIGALEREMRRAFYSPLMFRSDESSFTDSSESHPGWVFENKN